MSIAYLVVFSALAVVLHIFQYPFPLAPWLKFDLAGIPLAILSLTSLKLGSTGCLLLWLGSIIFTTDPTRIIGPSMKAIAEASTVLPFAYTYNKLKTKIEERVTMVIGFISGLIARVGVMLLLNYILTPYWLVWAGWMGSLGDARKFTLAYLPHNALFNIIVVCYIIPIAISVWKIVSRYVKLRR